MAPPPASLETSRLSSPAIALATAGRARDFSPLAFTYVRSRKRGITPQIEFSQSDPEHGRRVTPLECAVTKSASVSPLDSAVTNTGASISKHWTLSSFGMNSYKICTCNSFRMRSYKNRGEGGLHPLLNINYPKSLWLILLRNHAPANPYGSYSCGKTRPPPRPERSERIWGAFSA
jgi:hypothetical protein